MKSQPFDQRLDVNAFQQMVDRLCQSAAADFAAARDRLENLRSIGPDDDCDAE